MKKIGVFIISLFLFASAVFAATQEEIEAHYSAGLKHGNLGETDEAIKEFNAIIKAGPAGIPQDYYKQTLREAYFNLGILYGKKRDVAKSIELLKKTLEVDPDYNRAKYYLGCSLLMEGEFGEARAYYEELRKAGISGDPLNPAAGDYLKDTFDKIIEREVTVEYIPLIDDSKPIKVTVKGTFGADEVSVKDTLLAIDKVAYIMNQPFAANIKADFIRSKEDGTIIIEKWVIDDGKNKNEYWVTYDSTPPVDFPYKIMITVSDKEK